MESRRISSGEPFAIWISFENQSAQAIENLRFVEFRMPGFDTDGTCWRPVNPSDPKSPKAPACRPDFTDPTSPVGPPPTLQPGEAVTVTGQVVRGRRSGEFMLTGGYTWSDESGHQHRAMVPVGPIEIAKDWWDWRARLSEDLPVVLKDVVLPFAKDLAWPLVFFLLGWMFKAGEQKRAALQETWKEMLSTSHQIAVQHYLPLSSAIGALVETLAPGAVRDDAEPFYYFAVLFRRMRNLREKVGGFFFKDRVGESLAVASWRLLFSEFARSFAQGTGVEKKEVMIDSIGLEETLREYKGKLPDSEPPPFADPRRIELWQIRQAFEEWTRDEHFQHLVLPDLELFALVIDYETNRPYDPWYGEAKDFPLEDVVAKERQFGTWLQKAEPGLARRRQAQGSKTEEQKKQEELESNRIQEVKAVHEALRRFRRHNSARKAPWGTKWAVRWWHDLRLQAGEL